MLKLKLQRADSLEKTLVPGKIEDKRRRRVMRRRWLDHITDSMDMVLSLLREREKGRSPACCSSWSLKESDAT